MRLDSDDNQADSRLPNRLLAIRTKAMTRHITLAAIAFAALLATDHAASAQVVAYHHRSTVWGDHLAGASELVRAQGAFLRDEADAAEVWVRTEAAYDALQYQRAEFRYQEKRMFIEYQQQKAAARRERAATAENAEQAEAVRLWQQAQRGGVSWPAALKRSEYMASTSLLDSLLRSWTPETSGGDVYRRALATEAAVLRSRVAANVKIDFLARVDAVRTLDRVQRLADMPGLESDGSAQLAMR